MSTNLTYDQAFKKLTKLVEQIESDKTQIDTLAEKVAEAKTLIVFCEKKLRNVEQQVDAIVGTSKKK